MNAKKRRPTETDGGKTNTLEYTSSINSEDSTHGDEENAKDPPTRNSGSSNMSRVSGGLEQSVLPNANSSEFKDLSTSKSCGEEKVYFESLVYIDKQINKKTILDLLITSHTINVFTGALSRFWKKRAFRERECHL